MAKNVFREFEDEVYPFKYAGTLQIERLMGGIPSDPKVAEGWLKTKMGAMKEDILAEKVAEVMALRGIDEKAALDEVNKLKHLNGFYRDLDDGTLHIGGRHLKAAIKEAASVARAVDNLDPRYGSTNKGTLSFVAEHIIVVEDKLYIYKINPATGKAEAITEPDGVIQSFPKNPMTRQTGIQYTEYVDDAIIDFTVVSDYEFSKKEWATIWLTGGNQGVGASRSQGYGRYNITRWDMIGSGIKTLSAKAKAKKAPAAAEPASE